VLAGANLQIGKTPRVDAECGLIVCYDDNGARDKPVAVEFSYRYGNKDEGAIMTSLAVSLRVAP
jgi:hypothetical protein